MHPISPRARALAFAVAVAVVLVPGMVLAQDDAAADKPCPSAEAGMTSAASPAAGMSETPMAASPAASPTGESCMVDIRDLAFNPAEIEIALGTTVTWMNNDTVPHTATENDRVFDSGTLDPGATFSHTFDEAGSYEYVCLIHPVMTGSIAVQ